MRNALGSLRNPTGRNEFTPLLKSAAHNRFRKSTAGLHSHAEENENSTAEIVNSMIAAGPAAPATPAYLRSARKNARATPALPVESSVIYGEATGSSVEDATPLPPAVSSSAVLSSPMPTMPARGLDARGERKDVLTLRQQEVKLEKLDKENFALKLKIHFLDDMLTKTGTDYQQEIIKQNTELKVEKTTLTQDIRHQTKRLAKADKELLEYKQQLHDYAEKVKRRHTDEIMKEEMDRLRADVDESKRLLQVRDNEIESLQQKLDLADKGSGDKAQQLRDEISDLEMDIRQKEQACDEKDDQIDALEEKLRSVQADQEQVTAMGEDIAEMEAELEEKDQEIAELKSKLQTAGDRDKSTRKLRFDLGELETQIRDRDAAIDERDEAMKRLRKQSEDTSDAQSKTIRQLQSELKDNDRQLQQKIDEAQALQERLDTARGSWDAEAQQTDARLQERNVMVQQKENELRQALQSLEERANDIVDLKERVQKVHREAARTSDEHEQVVGQHAAQMSELQAKLRSTNAEFDREVDNKTAQIQAKDEEISRLTSQLRNDKPEDMESRRLEERLRELEAQLQDSVRQRKEDEHQLHTLQDRLARAGSPSKKDSLIEQQSAKITQLEQLCDGKECELEELENELTDAEAAVEAHKTEVARLQAQLRDADNDRSLAGHQGDEIRQMARLVKSLEDAKDAANDEVVVLEAAADEAQAEMRELRGKISSLESELSSLRAASSAATPARDRSELRQRMQEAEAQADNFKRQVVTLQDELSRASARGKNTTPMREREQLRAQLQDANDEISRLEHNLRTLQTEDRRDTGRSSSESNELHSLLRDAKIEVENLSLQLKEQDKRVTSLLRKDGELRIQLGQANIDLEDRAAALSDRDLRIEKLSTRETDLRAQVQQLKDSRNRVRELEDELEDRREGSTNHDRVEQRLRAKLNEARAGLEDAHRQIEIGAAARTAVASGKTHEKEMRGLVKQIQFLRAKCGREERFRRDLVFSKDWFLVQIAMYNEWYVVFSFFFPSLLLDTVSRRDMHTDNFLPPTQ